jgi:hypothetical protein
VGAILRGTDTCGRGINQQSEGGTMNKEERAADLWEREGQIAKRGLEWFNLLITLRRAAEREMPPEPLIEELRRANLDAMYDDYMKLTSVLYARFSLGRDKLQLSETRSDAGSKGAAARWEGHDEVGNIIARLAKRTDELGGIPDINELWPEFFAALGEAGLQPHDNSGAQVCDTDRMTWSGSDKGMTFKTFKNRISAARKKRITAAR